MTDTTLDQGGAIQQEEWSGDSHWVKRALAVAFFAGLVVTLVVVFTRVTGARVPEQRATLERLITERTGLVVRFDNVHFGWDLDGMNAVFSRVELTDPKAGRMRVIAPELRVEFDSWDFLRHQRFSLGHVTLSSPDIEIIGDPEETAAAPHGSKTGVSRAGGRTPDERTLVRQYLRWAELMPVGRIEVEGARVHLLRRGPGSKPVPGHSFTLSQAVVSRGTSTFNAHGTLLLSQDVGQSLFLSTKLEGLGPGSDISGDLRLIARRVFLQELPFTRLAGRGTIDAKFGLRDGRVDSGSWNLTARELEFPGEDPGEHEVRFDHVSVNGRLSRDADDVLVELTDLQLTRGARLERAPSLSARFALAPGSVDVVRTTAQAERLPFMATELLVGFLRPQIADLLPGESAGWVSTAGELQAVKYDSGARHRAVPAWTFSARASGVDLRRDSDQARLSQLAAQLRLDPRTLELRFDPALAARFNAGDAEQTRPLNLGGVLVVTRGDAAAEWKFVDFSAASGGASVALEGRWAPAAAGADSVRLHALELDQGLLRDGWRVLAPGQATPQFLADIEQGKILAGDFELRSSPDEGANWNRSGGSLTFDELVTGGKDMPRISAGRGSLKIARGGSRLELEGGNLDDLSIRSARFDRPRSGAPRMQAALAGSLESPLLRDLLDAQGIGRLQGDVELDVDARSERELRDPALWRVTARIRDASVPLGDGMPGIGSLAGTLRYSSGQLRGLSLDGQWLGGPISVESRRNGARGITLAIDGEAEANAVLSLLGREEAAANIDGRLAWTGSAQPGQDGRPWRLSFSSELEGVESRLPQPFGKSRSRAMPVAANFTVARDGVREFSVNAPQLMVRGQIAENAITADFEIQGTEGELRRPAGNSGDTELSISRLDLERAPQVLAVAGALLPGDSRMSVSIEDSHHAGRDFGPLQASVRREADGISFVLDSPAIATHQVSASGSCAQDRCRAEFSANSSQLASLLRDVKLPAEWPVASLRAAGTMEWELGAAPDAARSLAGQFEIQAEGVTREHQLTAQASLANGQISLTDIQGTGPEPDLVFRGNGRVGLMDRDYDITVDYQRVSLAAAAVPSTARAPLARAWNAVRGSVARRGWTEAPVTRRIQWHGSWEQQD